MPVVILDIVAKEQPAPGERVWITPLHDFSALCDADSEVLATCVSEGRLREYAAERGWYLQ